MNNIYINLSFLSCFAIFFSCKSVQKIDPQDMVFIEGETFVMGTDEQNGILGEFPKHQVSVSSFWMDKYEVTNQDFLDFVEATGYVTKAEKKIAWEEIKDLFSEGTEKPADSLLRPASLVFTPKEVSDYSDYTQWWTLVYGADWRHPTGSKSSIKDKMNHPVVHVSWEDAMAFAQWKGKDLPTEAEWELAAGVSKGSIYAWGTITPNDSKPQANYFQGKFPIQNSEEDDFPLTAPKASFVANEFGLYDMSGNVWEWCKDWYDVAYFSQCEKLGQVKNPQGAKSFNDPLEPGIPKRVVKGGSFLCNDSYCSGYKIARRMGMDYQSSANHTGFRCVKRIIEK